MSIHMPSEKAKASVNSILRVDVPSLMRVNVATYTSSPILTLPNLNPNPPVTPKLMVSLAAPTPGAKLRDRAEGDQGLSTGEIRRRQTKGGTTAILVPVTKLTTHLKLATREMLKVWLNRLSRQVNRLVSWSQTHHPAWKLPKKS